MVAGQPAGGTHHDHHDPNRSTRRSRRHRADRPHHPDRFRRRRRRLHHPRRAQRQPTAVEHRLLPVLLLRDPVPHRDLRELRGPRGRPLHPRPRLGFQQPDLPAVGPRAVGGQPARQDGQLHQGRTRMAHRVRHRRHRTRCLPLLHQDQVRRLRGRPLRDQERIRVQQHRPLRSGRHRPGHNDPGRCAGPVSARFRRLRAGEARHELRQPGAHRIRGIRRPHRWRVRAPLGGPPKPHRPRRRPRHRWPRFRDLVRPSDQARDQDRRRRTRRHERRPAEGHLRQRLHGGHQDQPRPDRVLRLCPRRRPRAPVPR